VTAAVTDLTEKISNFTDSLVEVVFDKVIAQWINVKELFTHDFVLLPDGEITIPDGVNQISGSSVFPTGDNEFFIANTKITAQSKILLTPTVRTDKVLSIVKKVEGSGFTVGIVGIANTEIPFDWIIVQSYRPDGIDSNPTTSGGASGGTSGSEPLHPIIDSSDEPPQGEVTSESPILDEGVTIPEEVASESVGTEQSGSEENTLTIEEPSADTPPSDEPAAESPSPAEEPPAEAPPTDTPPADEPPAGSSPPAEPPPSDGDNVPTV
jgi:hypothetical protein